MGKRPEDLELTSGDGPQAGAWTLDRLIRAGYAPYQERPCVKCREPLEIFQHVGTGRKVYLDAGVLTEHLATCS